MKRDLSTSTATVEVPTDPPLTAKQGSIVAGLSLAAFWRAVAAGRLPNPVYPLPKAPRWFASEIREAMLGLRMRPADAKVARAASRVNPSEAA